MTLRGDDRDDHSDEEEKDKTPNMSREEMIERDHSDEGGNEMDGRDDIPNDHLPTRYRSCLRDAQGSLLDSRL